MYQKIMIVVDDDAVARSAVIEGLALARAHAAEVLFFHVLPPYTQPVMTGELMPLDHGDPAEHERHVTARAARILAEAAGLAKAQAVASHGLLGHDADAADGVAQAAQAHGCQLIVVGSHGRSMLQRLLHGSLVTRLLSLTPLPVLVCKPHAALADEAG